MKLSWFLSDGGHGYATVGHKLRDAVTAAGAELLAEYRVDWDSLIVVHPPTRGYLTGPHPRPDVIFHTMVETPRLPSMWRETINRTGATWVPSLFCEQVFRDGGVTVPIIRTGYAVEGIPIRREERDAPFRVLAWGDSLASRKNILLAIQAFIDANLPDATLDVKLNLGDYPIPSATWVDSSGKEYPNIRVCHAQWPRTTVIDWLRSGDVGIYLSGGEGYGLMPKEMMATGLPVVDIYGENNIYDLPSDAVMLSYPEPENVALSILSLLNDAQRSKEMSDKAVDFIKHRNQLNEKRMFKDGIEGGENFIPIIESLSKNVPVDYFSLEEKPILHYGNFRMKYPYSKLRRLAKKLGRK